MRVDAWQKEDLDYIKYRYENGATLQEIGDVYGISRERIRQVLNKNFPGFIDSVKQLRREDFIQNKPAKPIYISTCPICLRKFETSWSSIKYCSNICEEIANAVRRRRSSPHKMTLARHYLKYPEKYRDSKIQWAKEAVEEYEKTGSISARRPPFRHRQSSLLNKMRRAGLSQERIDYLFEHGRNAIEGYGVR